MIRPTPTAAALLLLLATSAARAAPARKAEQPAAPALPRFAHEKLLLPNGMTVILHEDHAVPLATVNVWYGVGSKDEDPGRSGFAHLFEHLMFMGTERVPGADFDALMERGGGHNNASTGTDRTNYWSIGPSEILPTLLWLDADRLEDLGRTMTVEKLDRQRDVVRNERRQSVENAPYGKSEVALDEFLFPEGHPYHVSVIGRHEDLVAATLSDVVSFFNRFYVPANASLVVAGDFDPAVVRPLVESLFGTLEPKPMPRHAQAEPVRLAAATRVTLEDAVQLPRTTSAWLSPPRFAPGDAEMDVLASVLAWGKSSRLHAKLVREMRACVDVTAYQESRELQSVFHVAATCNPDADLDEVERVIDEVVEDHRRKGPTPAELTRVQAGLERQLLGQAEELQSRADMLNAYQHFLGDPDRLAWDVERYRKVTTRSARDEAERVLLPDARVVMRVVPQRPDPRDTPPPAAPASAYAFPRPETFTLANGLTVHHWTREDMPLAGARLVVPGGAALDRPERAGLTRLMLDMLSEGTVERTAAEFADALDQLGASFDVDARRESSTVALTALPRTFESAVGLFAEALAQPAFRADDFERVRARMVADRKRAEDDPHEVAAIVASRALFGPEHPFGQPVRGDSITVAGLSLEDVRALHASTVRPDRVTLLTAGPMTAEAVRQAVERSALGSAKAPDTPPAESPRIAPSVARPQEVFFVHRPQAVQTVLRYAWPAPRFDTPDRLRIETLNAILGGSFTSRLNQNLREAHGYSYGASSRAQLEPSAGLHVAASAVRSDVTAESLAEFQKEFDRLVASDLTEEEVGKGVATVKRSLVESAEGVSGVLDVAERLLVNGLPFDAFDRWLSDLDRVDLASLRALAPTRIVPGQGVLVLVGDRDVVLKAVAARGLPSPRELDVRGAPVR